MIKRVILTSMMSIAFVTVANAQSLSLFGNTLTNKVYPNCTIRAEYNDFTKQWTNNEVCNPKIVEYNNGQPVSNTVGGTYYNTAPTYSYPTYSYVNTIPSYTTYSANPFAQYFGSNLWNTPANTYGYLSSSMFNTYFRGGPSDYTGYYQPNDSVVYDRYDRDLEDYYNYKLYGTDGYDNGYRYQNDVMTPSEVARFEREDDRFDMIYDWPNAYGTN